ncbi:MAG: carbohydrate ABC transporter permease [Eubacteriales bacterium]|nr:carbohydrate ABC transporter permease [Eubacteriales bacterium]
MANKNTQKEVNRLIQVSVPTNILFNIILLIFALACIIPFIVVVIISFTHENSIAQYGYQIIPKELSLDSYMFLWNERSTILRSLSVSLFVTAIGTVSGVLMTSVLGYVLSRKQYIFRNLLVWMVFIPMIFNGGMVASYAINIQMLKFKNGLHALILPLLVSSFNVVIARTFFQQTIPDAIIESAKIDGASELRIFATIVLPVSTPVLATLGLFLAFGYWNDWYLSMLYITEQSKYSIQYLLQQIVANIEFIAKTPGIGASMQEYVNKMPREGVRMAIAVIIVLPIAIVYPFFQKYFISGLTIGAVKG